MTGIISSTGLLSGLPTQDLINQIIAIESRPITLLQKRVSTIQTERTAFIDLSARLLSLKGIVSAFKQSTFFNTFKATSSNESVLTATAGSSARPGSFRFIVHSLVTNHQLIAGGMSDSDTTPVGSGTITMEIGNGKLNPSTPLDRLNDGEGVRRGKISITDRNGDSVELDLTTTLTVDDVLDAINSQSQAAVYATVSGDHIVIEDQTGLSTGTLTVANVGGGSTATDLGIEGSDSVDGRIEGSDVINLDDSTSLSLLNDGNGVRRAKAGDDFQITDPDGNSFAVSLSDFLDFSTRLEQLNSGNGVRLGTIRLTDRSGATSEVDLSSAETIQDVLDAINGAGVGISATFVSSHLQISDTTGTVEDKGTNLKIEDVTGSSAQDLGIAADTEDDNIIGSNIFRIATVGDVIRAINFAVGNFDGYEPTVRAAVSTDGNGIALTYDGTGTGPIVVEALADDGGAFSQAAIDLGIEGTFDSAQVVSRDLIAGLNTVLLRSLNGGAGVDSNSIQVTARDGTVHVYDLSGAQTVHAVLDIINSVTETSHVSARVNAAGNGIEIVDESDTVSSNLKVEDVGGTTATDLGLVADVAADSINSGTLQLRYISESTRLDELNHGEGVQTGQFRITNSLGAVYTINVTSSQKDLGDILNLINARSDESNVVASINANGDGLVLTDTAGGAETLRVDDLDGSPAADLNIAAQADESTNVLDGSFEVTVQIDADDTLEDVVARLNSAGAGFSASILNDGSGTNPYRLTVTSDVTGRRGELIFDAGDTGLAMETMVRARDALIVLGGDDAVNPIVVSSPTNTLDDVFEGVSIDLIGTSQDPVDLGIAQDLEDIISQLKSFVTNFNSVGDRIDDLTSYDPETEMRGTLLGDSTVYRIRDRLNRAILSDYDAGPDRLNRLSDVGIRMASGGRLEFDEEKFREVYTDDPETVEELFTDDEEGIGAFLDDLLDELTRDSDGLIARRDDTLEAQEQDLNDRIEAMQVLLDGRRARLEQQFLALEMALGQLQAQQAALTALQLSAG